MRQTSTVLLLRDAQRYASRCKTLQTMSLSRIENLSYNEKRLLINIQINVVSSSFLTVLAWLVKFMFSIVDFSCILKDVIRET